MLAVKSLKDQFLTHHKHNLFPPLRMQRC
ncbi:hypothetical protein CY0110_17022 [Crocosphaera chwakensis CCY0110]|uniref:Uncharacterized protein n=1 Tax=Crocosphaera chwakensis CCY0110 TaxID=391612 RepID=A3II86_9CHRO|nr:hypothetical protein CY0110_17022 [Crocosphaera chwakensis CCY0110]